MLPPLLGPQIDLLFDDTSCHLSSHLLQSIGREKLVLLKQNAEIINPSVVLSWSLHFLDVSSPVVPF